MRYLSLNLIAVLIFFTSPGLAEEGGGEEAKNASGGISKDSIEYYKKEGRLNSLKTKIEEAEKAFKQNLEAKNLTKDPEEKKRYANALMAIAKERNAFVRELSEIRAELKYRYPNKGEDIDKRFVPKEERTVQQLEDASDLDIKLSEVKEDVDKKYKALMPKEEPVAEQYVPTQSAPVESKKKLRLEK